MWVCQHCHSENKDTSATCSACGTPRPMRRFGSAPQARSAAPVSSAPVVASAQPSDQTAASTQPIPDARSAAAARAAYQATVQQRENEEYYDDEEEMDRPRRGGSVFGKLVGGLLIVLLPLYLTEKAPDWLRSVFYGMLTAAAVLLSMLPGLWTILLSRNNRNHF